MRSAVALLGEKEVRDIVAEQGKIEVGDARGDTMACFTPEGAAACTARAVRISTVYCVCATGRYHSPLPLRTPRAC
jgi:hypothetical protein